MPELNCYNPDAYIVHAHLVQNSAAVPSPHQHIYVYAYKAHTDLMISSEGDGRALLVEYGNVGCRGTQVWSGRQHTANLRPWLLEV